MAKISKPAVPEIHRDHLIVCRLSPGADQWASVVDAGGVLCRINERQGTTLEQQVRAILRVAADMDMQPNISFTSRDMDSIALVPPTTEAISADNLHRWKDAVITVLLPVGFSYGDRWMSACRTSGRFDELMARFVPKRIEDRILSYFSAGEDRQLTDPKPFKTFGKQPGMLSELWVRPSYSGVEAFGLKEAPPIPPNRAAEIARERSASFQHKKKLRERQMIGKGYVARSDRGQKVWHKPQA